MKRWIALILIFSNIPLFFACQENKSPDIVATTLPVYEFTSILCKDTGLTVDQLITENVSCLHDYTLQVDQMRTLEAADLVVVTGAGLEDFLPKIEESKILDSSKNISLYCHGDNDAHSSEHHNADHHHEDPHIWLSVTNGKIMCENIYNGLITKFPEFSTIFSQNYNILIQRMDELKTYGQAQLSDLKSRKIITFHDGFSYLAESYGVEIIKSIEEEAGSEASAAELKEIIELIRKHELQAIFIEKSGSSSAANIISNETSTAIYTLDMAISGESYFNAMYHNIDTLKEALG